MHKSALLLTTLLLACGDETVTTATTTATTTTTSDDTSTSTGVTPTSTGETSTTTTTSGTDAASSTLDPTTTSDTGTTQAVGDTSTSSTTGDDTTSSTSTTSDDTTTTSDDTTSSSSSTTSDDTTTSVETGEDTDAPPMPEGVCAMGELTTYAVQAPEPEELHIVGVYQATGNALTVHVNRTGVPLTLVLASYEPVAFTLVLAPGAMLEHVILNGYNLHSVQGQGAATVTNISAMFGDPFWEACGYYWPMNDQGCNTPMLAADAEAMTGLTLTSFAGCYEGGSFTLE